MVGPVRSTVGRGKRIEVGVDVQRRRQGAWGIGLKDRRLEGLHGFKVQCGRHLVLAQGVFHG